MDPSTILVVGLPSAGKTTFLAAAWNAIRKEPVSSDLSLRRLPPELEYLNRLSDAWLACQPADHTSAGFVHPVELELRGPGEGGLDLSMLDYSGEVIRDAWANRRWPGDFDTTVRRAVAAILLVHPGHITPHVSIEEYSRRARALEAGPPDPTLRAEPFALENVPTQAMLVDTLQFVRDRSRHRRLYVALVVSAWDLVEPEGKNPRQWVASNLPLLDQFLASNADSLPNQVFGASAQGGDWPSEALLAQSPLSRCYAVDATGTRSAQFLSPIRWAMRPT
jgi:hypothetical protein